MRVLYIIGTLNPESGGPASSVATLIRFSPADCQSEVVSLDDPASPFLAGLDFETHPLGPIRTRYGYTPKLLPWLRANAYRFDGVVVHGLWQYCGLCAWRVFGGRKPYMVFAHGMLDPYFKRAYPLKHLKKWVYWLLVEYWVLRGASRVLFTCAAEATLARQSFFLHHWNSHIVQYGASVPKADDDHRMQAFLRRFPELQGKRYLLFLGRIARKKGCDLLLEAFTQVAALDPGLHLVMAGPDERNWRDELDTVVLNAGLADRVHWTGMLRGDNKWGAFLAAEAFILPSHQENFGIAVAEAMACGKPVLLSDKVNIAADILNARAGLMQTDDAVGTRRLLEDWIATPAEQRLDMGVRARRLFEKDYDMRKNTRDFTQLFRRQLEPQRSVPVASTPAVE